MSANEIANALHAGGLLKLNNLDSFDPGQPLIVTGWGLRSIRFQPGNPSNDVPPAFFISLVEPIYGVNPFQNPDEVARGFVVATPQTGYYDGNEFVPFITYASLVPQYGPEPGGVRIFMQDPRTEDAFLSGPIMMSLLVFRSPT